MTEKIDWYKEVLELEPNSKVFYPLSRLLAEAGRTDEAVATLEQGLARHEEFLEARLFLVELLHQLGQDTACTAQLDRLGQVFSAHAGFWRAFAACAATREAAPDTAAALQFLALYFARGPVPLHLVVERGVASYWAEADQPSTARPTAPAVSSTAKAAAGPSPTASRMSECVPSPTVTPTAAAVAPRTSARRCRWKMTALPVLTRMRPWRTKANCRASIPLRPPRFLLPHLRPRPRQRIPTPQPPGLRSLPGPPWSRLPAVKRLFRCAPVPWPKCWPNRATSRQRWTFTRLAAAAVDPEEIADLRQRISTLSARLGGGPTASAPAADPAPSAGGKEKLITMLEALAGRVEARAHG